MVKNLFLATFALIFSFFATSSDSLADSHSHDFDSSNYDDVMQEIDQEEDLTYFESMLHLSGLFDKINNGEDYTVFAPTNKYFTKLGSDILAKLESPNNRAKLRRFLGYHIVEGSVQLTNLTGNTNRMETISGDVIIVKKLGRRTLTINGRKITSTDMHPDGILYMLDGFAVDIEHWEFKEAEPKPKEEPQIDLLR